MPKAIGNPMEDHIGSAAHVDVFGTLLQLLRVVLTVVEFIKTQVASYIVEDAMRGAPI
jgi:hypothetical protein